MTPITVYSPPVETLRKPSTGLKRIHGVGGGGWGTVETLRKPSTGLKRLTLTCGRLRPSCRDTQKTQHGIETPRWYLGDLEGGGVETLRKPSTGLKRLGSQGLRGWSVVETLRKPSTGLKQHESAVAASWSTVETLRKPSTGLKHCPAVCVRAPRAGSRHSENPARD